MLLVDNACNHSYIFSNHSMHPGYECFVITEMLTSCYGQYHTFMYIHYVSMVSRRGRTCLTFLLNYDAWGRYCLKGHRFSPIPSSLSHNCSNKTFRNGIFGLGMAPKEILSCIFSPFKLKTLILDLYLETWLFVAADMCRKSPSRGSIYRYYIKAYTFNNSAYFTNSLVFLLLSSYCYFY